MICYKFRATSPSLWIAKVDVRFKHYVRRSVLIGNEGKRGTCEICLF